MRLVALAVAFRPEPVARATPDVAAVVPRAASWTVAADAAVATDGNTAATDADGRANATAHIGVVEAHGLPQAEVPLAGFVELWQTEVLPQNPLDEDLVATGVGGRPRSTLAKPKIYGGFIENSDTKILFRIFWIMGMTVLLISYVMNKDEDNAIEDGIGVKGAGLDKTKSNELERDQRHADKKKAKKCEKLLDEGLPYAEIAAELGLSVERVAEVAVKKARKEKVEIQTGAEKDRAKAFMYRTKLSRFYEAFNPEKLDMIDTILEQYAGREDKLFQSLADKYQTANPLLEDDSEPEGYGYVFSDSSSADRSSSGQGSAAGRAADSAAGSAADSAAGSAADSAASRPDGSNAAGRPDGSGSGGGSSDGNGDGRGDGRGSGSADSEVGLPLDSSSSESLAD